ncbi:MULTISPECIES: hypothetical protein [Haloferax]|nr:hypothetical protein [Haloferax mediterranei]MDX5987559.1 hypothetical protein [Haloferax mediterranei ATCC 33500]
MSDDYFDLGDTVREHASADVAPELFPVSTVDSDSASADESGHAVEPD